jgi:hypothetical protein
MKKLISVFVLLLLASSINAQDATIKLQPIKINGSQLFNFERYSYGNQNFANPRKLEIPIISLGDEQAIKYYKRFKTYKTLSDICIVAMVTPAFVKFIQGNQVREVWKSDELNASCVGIGLVGIALHFIANNQVKKSINHYNEALGKRLNMSFSNPTPNPIGIGLSLSYSLSR